MSRPPRGLIGAIVVRMVAAVLALAGLFFGTAGTFDYWEAWIYLIVVFVPTCLVLLFLARRDPALLERRLRRTERRSAQRTALSLSTLVILLAFVLPGLDRRFGWSSVPAPAVIAADGVFLVGYGLFFLVLRENSFASRVVEIQAGQRVVATGPYRWVRHPMYLAVLVTYIASPLALASIWALLPALFLPIILAGRIRDEERLLESELEGYREYQAKTRYRLFPGVW